MKWTDGSKIRRKLIDVTIEERANNVSYRKTKDPLLKIHWKTSRNKFLKFFETKISRICLQLVFGSVTDWATLFDGGFENKVTTQLREDGDVDFTDFRRPTSRCGGAATGRGRGRGPWPAPTPRAAANAGAATRRRDPIVDVVDIVVDIVVVVVDVVVVEAPIRPEARYQEGGHHRSFDGRETKMNEKNNLMT